MREHGQLIPIEKIQEIVDQLDREFYLDSERFQEQQKSILEQYRSAPFREASHAGTAYEGDPKALTLQLDELLKSIDGQKPIDPLPKSGSLSLLISPHIDLHRGGPCFAHAYRTLLREEPADLYVILGTGHQSERSFISLTKKSYSTPLGIVETDVDFIETLNQSVPEDLFDEEILHRDEHSVEFQILWLRHIFGNEWKGKVAPILCGSFHSFIVKGESPREDARLAPFLDVLRETIDSHPGRVAIVAGVDLSHVGQRFGHPQGIPPNELERVKNDDEEVLNAMRTGNAERFFRTIEKKKDRNNICGLSPIYIALDAARVNNGYLLQYDRAIEEDAQSVVTYASMAFFDQK